MPAEPGPQQIVCNLDQLLQDRGLTLTALAGAVGVTPVNLSILKNNRAKGIPFATLSAICQVLECQPGDLLVTKDQPPPPRA